MMKQGWQATWQTIVMKLQRSKAYKYVLLYIILCYTHWTSVVYLNINPSYACKFPKGLIILKTHRFCWFIKQLMFNILDIGSACLTSHFWLLLTLEWRKRVWGGRNMVGGSMHCDGMLIEQDAWRWIPKPDMVIKIKPVEKLKIFSFKKLALHRKKIFKGLLDCCFCSLRGKCSVFQCISHCFDIGRLPYLYLHFP